MSGLEVINPGFLSLIQDLGRHGSAYLGLSPGGPIDLHAFCWGNKLLNNSADAAAIEITLGQASFKATKDILLALTGAEMQATVDGQPQANWHTFVLKKGQVLSLGIAHSGLRAYVSVAGGIKAPLVFNSAATVCRNQLGGLAEHNNKFGLGNKLRQADQLLVDDLTLTGSPLTHHSVPARYVTTYPTEIMLNLIESYQCDAFSAEQKSRFYQSKYEVTPHSDRMGIRLAGPAISSELAGIISEGIALGSVQIPPDGQPIILLNDRQTLGGYPKLGCIAKRDLFKIAQARPGTLVRFQPANLQQQTKNWCEFMRFFKL